MTSPQPGNLWHSTLLHIYSRPPCPANLIMGNDQLLKRGRLSRGSECLFFLYGNDDGNLISVSFLPASVPAGLSSPKSPWPSRSGFSPCLNPYRPTHNY